VLLLLPPKMQQGLFVSGIATALLLLLLLVVMLWAANRSQLKQCRMLQHQKQPQMQGGMSASNPQHSMKLTAAQQQQQQLMVCSS
jgi:hypothetical protein